MKLGNPGGITVAACGAAEPVCGGVTTGGACEMLCAEPGRDICGMKCASECMSGIIFALPCCCAWAAATAPQAHGVNQLH